MMQRRNFIFGATYGAAFGAMSNPLYAKGLKNEVVIQGQAIATVPQWAILQREVFNTSSKACKIFYEKYFDENGYFKCFERWGANDGPDDAIENVNDWPILHALGGAEYVKTLYEKAWKGHLNQYSKAKTIEIQAGRNGMYSRDFSVMNDWQHLSEGLTAFNSMGLSNPNSSELSKYAKFGADLYNGRDKIARNYDPKLKIIRSIITGSNGPLLRHATALDWAGDPFDTSPFFMEHGERNYQETLAHYDEYTDIIGDNPMNLQSTSLALSAYMFTKDNFIRKWIIEYVYAWANRMHENSGLIPSKISLDGRLNSKDQPWWSGVYGWNFSPIVPQTGKRENRNRVPRSIVGFFNAFLLTNDHSLLQLWRNQANILNNNGKFIDGEFQTPTMYGENGWYGYQEGKSQANWRDIWYFSMDENDLTQVASSHPWIDFLKGKNPTFPQDSLSSDLKELNSRVEKIKEDKNSKATRLADAVLGLNTALVTNLIHQTVGGIRIARPPWSKTSPQQGGAHLFSRLRHFDILNKRAGLPEGVSALVKSISKTETLLEMINLNSKDTKTIITQIGGFAEHRLKGVLVNGNYQKCEGGNIKFVLKPRHHVEIKIFHELYANQPTFEWPI